MKKENNLDPKTKDKPTTIQMAEDTIEIRELQPLETLHPWCWKRLKSPETNIYCITMFSTIITMLVGMAGIFSWNQSGSSLIFGLGMLNSVECIRNMILLWRFSRSNADTPETIIARDEKSSILITSIMVLVGIGIIILCIIDFNMGYEEINVTYLLSISIPSTLFFALLGYLKMHYSPILKSSALALDGLSSYLFSMFSFWMLISTLIIMKNPGAWWLDPLIAFILACTCIIISLNVLHANIIVMGVPCCSITYWFSNVNEVENRRGTLEFSTMEVFTV